MNFYTLKEIETKVSWLSNYIIHNANHLRVKDDDLKVGGHQASCSSVVSILVVLYFKILDKLMEHPFILEAPPKSTDINEYGYNLLEEIMDDNKEINSYGLREAWNNLKS